MTRSGSDSHRVEHEQCMGSGCGADLHVGPHAVHVGPVLFMLDPVVGTESLNPRRRPHQCLGWAHLL